MYRFVLFALVAGSNITLDHQLALGDDDADQFRQEVQPLLKQYCTTCHAGDTPEAELQLDQFSKLADVNANRDLWTDVLEMLRDEAMPPDEEPQPTAEEREALIIWIEDQLANYDCSQQVFPGRVTIRRLNRSEYNNTIRDLLGIDVDPGKDFPADDVGHGFDNIADVLSMPPILLEKYLAAAEQIIEELKSDEHALSRVINEYPSDKRDEDSCALDQLGRFAARAYRRRVRSSDSNRLLHLYKVARKQGDSYEEAILFAIKGGLISPRFLFRIEFDDDWKADENRRLDDYELASRLSYFLWSSMPDDELFRLAEDKQLNREGVLESQVTRMLNDPKASSLVDNFAAQWLKLRFLTTLTPDPSLFPTFDDSLRSAMIRESKLFFAEIVREDRSILEFLDADFTFLNGRLAKHYGIPDITGEEFQRVNVAGSQRGGLLTQASVLTLTSNPTRTSPVKRGLWILENILGAPPPPPPPGVMDLAEGDEAELLGTLRERMQLHRDNPSCAVCHRKMDALGLGFENFDAVGAWREQDGKHPINPAGELPGNLTFQGPTELRKLLKQTKKQEFTRCFVEKLLTFALGRGVESYDECAVDDIIEHVQANDFRFSSAVLAIVNSDPFRMRGKTGDEQ